MILKSVLSMFFMLLKVSSSLSMKSKIRGSFTFEDGLFVCLFHFLNLFGIFYVLQQLCALLFTVRAFYALEFRVDQTQVTLVS